MNNCKDCKYWRRGGEFKNNALVCDDSKKDGICINEHITCDNIENWLERPFDHKTPSGGIFAQSDWDGWLFVDEMFGCIHFESK